MLINKCRLIELLECTLFAPSNLALGDVVGTLRSLSADELREVALHHVVTGHVPRSAFRNELLTPVTLAASRRLRINIYNKSSEPIVCIFGFLFFVVTASSSGEGCN